MVSLRLVRYGGLAGSALLSVAAWRSGATSPWHPTMTPRTIAAGVDGWLSPLCWLLGTAGLIAAWWAGRRVVPSVRWALVTAGLWLIPLLPAPPLESYDVYSYACQGWQQSAGLDPYSAGVSVLGCPWRAAVAPTWLHSPAPYGPVFLVLAAAAATVGGSLAGTVAVLRAIALGGVLLIALGVPVLARRSGVPAERATWLALACPIVAIHLVSGAHNDALMTGLIVAALALLATQPGVAAGRPVGVGVLAGAGVLLGLAAGVKVTAAVVVPFAVLLAVPPGAPLRALVRPALWLAGAAVAVIAAVSLAAGLGLGWVAGIAGSGKSVQWTSPSTALGMTVNVLAGAHVDAVGVTRVLGVIALAVALLVLWWRSRRGGALLGAGLALAATVVLAPVFHPWYATWPLAVLAATLPRDTRWLTVPCAVAAALCLPDGYNLALAVKAQGAIAMTALVAAVAVLTARRTRGNP